MSNREYCLDGIKYLACMIIFWTHYNGAFYSLCAQNPGLGPRMEWLLTHSPVKILTDSAMMLCIFLMISGYLAAAKRIRSFRELWQACLFRYLRFALPFLFANLLVCVLWYTVGFRTQPAADILHNDWVRGYYVIPVTPFVAVREALTLGSLANGPLWMMRHLAGATCAVYVWSYVREKIPGIGKETEHDGNGRVAEILFFILTFLLVAGFCTFAERSLHWNGMYLVEACFLGVLMRVLPPVPEKVQERCRMLFSALAILGIALEAQGYVTLLKMGFRQREGGIPPVFLWNIWYCMAFSFLFLWAIRYAGLPRRILETGLMRKLSEISFAVFLLHWPVIAAFSFRLLIRMVNTMSYNRVYVIILALTTLAVTALGFLYEMTCGHLAERLTKQLQNAVRRRWPVS